MLSCKQIPSKESIDLSSGKRSEQFGATDRFSQASASEYFYDLGSAVPVNYCKRLYYYCIYIYIHIYIYIYTYIYIYKHNYIYLYR